MGLTLLRLKRTRRVVVVCARIADAVYVICIIRIGRYNFERSFEVIVNRGRIGSRRYGRWPLSGIGMMVGRRHLICILMTTIVIRYERISYANRVTVHFAQVRIAVGRSFRFAQQNYLTHGRGREVSLRYFNPQYFSLKWLFTF